MNKQFVFGLFARPKIFFLGVCIGILICTLAGRKLSDKGYFENFARIGGAHSNGTAFLVTASQISALIRTTCRSDQILVLAGGSSIIMGTGQPISYVWTKKLQEILGRRYCVYNLASPAGWLTGYGSVTMNMVGKEFKDVFLVSNSLNPPKDADGQIEYKHFFWDAYYKGLLENGLVNYSDERIRKINETHLKADDKTKVRIEQMKIGMWLDSFLYFNDLWTFVHYTMGQTIYSKNSGPYNWKPQGSIPDYDWRFDEAEIRTLKHYPAPDSPQFEVTLNMVRGHAPRYFKTLPEGRFLIEELIIQNETLIKEYPLTDVAEKIIITQDIHSPYYISRLSEAEQLEYAELTKRIEETWMHNGYHVISMDGMGPEDYADMMHPNVLGGWKYAEKVSAKILSMTNQP